MSKNKILIVDDEADIRRLIRGILEDEGYEIIEAENSKQAFENFDAEKPDLAILDIWLQGSDKDGLEILTNYKEKDPHFPVLMISGHGNIETAVNAIKNGAYDFIEKPFKSDRLLLMITRALESATIKKENTVLKDDNTVTKELFLSLSPQLTEFYSRLNTLLKSSKPILLEGDDEALKVRIKKIIEEKYADGVIALKASEIDDVPYEILEIPQFYEKSGDLSALHDLPLKQAREAFEREYLLTQIGKFDGNISKTAEFVGMERSALHRKLKSLDISTDDTQNSVTAVNRQAV